MRLKTNKTKSFYNGPNSKPCHSPSHYLGFTLIELLVVIAIIGVLASIIFVSLQNGRMRARDARRLHDVQVIITALELFYDDHGHYPDANEGIHRLGECIGAPCGNSDGLEAALQPYLPEIPRDPRHDCEANPMSVGNECDDKFFYAYDFSHDGSLPGSCVIDPAVVGNAPSGGVAVSINRLEILTGSKDTCAGPDMNINQASYNIFLCKNRESNVCSNKLTLAQMLLR